MVDDFFKEPKHKKDCSHFNVETEISLTKHSKKQPKNQTQIIRDFMSLM